MDRDNDESQEPDRAANFTNYGEMMPDPKIEKPESSVWGEVTMPESRRYGPTEPYRFLIHSTVQNPREIYRHLTDGVEPGGEFQLSDHQLSASLIDQEHTATFEGEGGLIIHPPRAAASIRGAFASDGGGAAFSGEHSLPSASDLLAQTAPGDYNHVNLTSGAVDGVFIRIAADTGEELGNHGRNASLRELAIEHNLPVAELNIRPNEIHEAPPSYEDGGETASGGHLWHVSVPHEGYLYRVDIARMGADGAIAARAAKIDRYDVWDRKMTDAEFLELDEVLVDLTASNTDNPAIPAARAELSRQHANS